MGNHPFLTFLLVLIIATAVKFIINRLLRHMNIRKHGWPPEHCDADGDLKDTDE